MKKHLFALLLAILSITTFIPLYAADEDMAQFVSLSTSGIGSNSATLVFTTTDPTVSTSVYGTSLSYGSTGPSTSMGTSHSATFTNLNPGTLYYYKVTLPGGEMSTGSFTTTAAPVSEEKDPAQFVTMSTTGTTQNSATLSFTTTESTVSTSVYGLTTSYGSTGPSTAMSTNHSATFTGLLPSRTYYYKVTLTGGEISTGSFTTSNAPVVVENKDPAQFISVSTTGITQNTATLSFTTTESTVSSSVYGLTTGYGSTGPATGMGTNHSATFTGLSAGTTYYYRITLTGGEIFSGSFITSASSAVLIPSVTLSSINSLTPTSAVLQANLVSSQNAAITSRGFEWGLTTAYGNTSTIPGSLSVGSSFSQSLTGLSPSTTYRYRAFATNSAGKGVSSVGTFTTSAAPAAPVTSTPVVTSSSGGGNFSAPTNTGSSYCPAGLICTAAVNTGANMPSNASVFQFAKNLAVGMKGDDVKALQVYLNNNGFKISLSGAGSPGLETTYFGNATKVALINFQKSVGIVPASGFFGPLTRAKLTGGVATSGSIAVNTQVTTSAPLVLGNDNLAVKALRTLLRTKGYLSAYGTAGVPASASVETTYFGVETEKALKNFQCEAKVVCSGTPNTTGWGKVGPKTKAALGL